MKATRLYVRNHSWLFVSAFEEGAYPSGACFLICTRSPPVLGQSQCAPFSRKSLPLLCLRLYRRARQLADQDIFKDRQSTLLGEGGLGAFETEETFLYMLPRSYVSNLISGRERHGRRRLLLEQKASLFCCI